MTPIEAALRDSPEYLALRQEARELQAEHTRIGQRLIEIQNRCRALIRQHNASAPDLVQMRVLDSSPRKPVVWNEPLPPHLWSEKLRSER